MFRSLRVLICLGLVAALLAGCSGIPKPFSREKSWFNTSDPDAPPVTISAIDGPPKATIDRMAAQFYTESKHRGFTTTTGKGTRKSIKMKGHMTAAPTANGTTVIYVWDVRGPDGRATYRISGEETIPGGEAFADPWAAVDDSAMQRIAVKTTEELSLFISQLGYDAKMGTVPPPADMLTDQADTIQTASITGLTTTVAPASQAEPRSQTQARPRSVTQAETQQAALTQPPAAASPPAAEPDAANTKPKKSKPRKKANAIAVPMVVGAAGAGNKELAAAMRQAMAVAGVPVIKKQRKGAIVVAGQVKLLPPSGSSQVVELAWRVLDAEGVLLGTIAQKNQVPAGSLDNGWGPSANLAAKAAANGVFKLLANAQ